MGEKFNDTHNTTDIYQLFVHMMLVREQVKQGTEVWGSEKWKIFLKDNFEAQEDVHEDDEDGYISYEECSSDLKRMRLLPTARTMTPTGPLVDHADVWK